jgi:hypothetical protein
VSSELLIAVVDPGPLEVSSDVAMPVLLSAAVVIGAVVIGSVGSMPLLLSSPKPPPVVVGHAVSSSVEAHKASKDERGMVSGSNRQSAKGE